MSFETILTNAPRRHRRCRVRRHRRRSRRPHRRDRHRALPRRGRHRSGRRLSRARPGRAAHRQHGKALRAATGREVAERVGGDGARHPDQRRRHHDGVRFAGAGRRPRQVGPRAEPRAHDRGRLPRERPAHDARRAPHPPALRDHGRRCRRGRRQVDRPAAGRPGVDQRPHARPAPVPRSGEAEAILQGQVFA